jgi:hypothetical protein
VNNDPNDCSWMCACIAYPATSSGLTLRRILARLAAPFRFSTYLCLMPSTGCSCDAAAAAVSAAGTRTTEETVRRTTLHKALELELSCDLYLPGMRTRIVGGQRSHQFERKTGSGTADKRALSSIAADDAHRQTQSSIQRYASPAALKQCQILLLSCEATSAVRGRRWSTDQLLTLYCSSSSRISEYRPSRARVSR